MKPEKLIPSGIVTLITPGTNLRSAQSAEQYSDVLLGWDGEYITMFKNRFGDLSDAMEVINGLKYANSGRADKSLVEYCTGRKSGNIFDRIGPEMVKRMVKSTMSKQELIAFLGICDYMADDEIADMTGLSVKEVRKLRHNK